jgi:hypothetical protein
MDISKLRFDALAGYVRDYRTSLYSVEQSWHSTSDEKVLGVVILDKNDGDFAGNVLGRDLKRRYRWVVMTDFFPTAHEAKNALKALMGEYSDRDETEFSQGDEVGEAVDFFTPVAPEERLNSDFLKLMNLEGFSPAREIISAMMYYFNDVDGNFVEQFQTTGFDARIWELYLFAAFHELGFGFDSTHSAPDYHCFGIGSEFLVEATTVNPTKRGGVPVIVQVPENPQLQESYFQNYLPIKFGSSLYSKLQKKYWEREHVCGKSLALAIQDFQAPASMNISSNALLEYLYGQRHDPQSTSNRTTPIRSHEYDGKSIPSGFFKLADSENIAAVFFNVSATISKFNRMGCLAGFGSDRVKLTRIGPWYNHSDNAETPEFRTQEVVVSKYSETWVEGLSVCFNPEAKHPFDPNIFIGAALHIQDPETGSVSSYLPENHPFGTRTFIEIQG